MVVLLAALCPRSAAAGGTDCHKCGCQHHVKKQLVAVVECRKIETPQYECVPTNVFHPSKEIVCKSECRCDKICKLHVSCDCTIGCTCKIDCGYKRQYGASPCGTHSNCNVRQPAGTDECCMPVVKWISVPLCEGCLQKEASATPAAPRCK